MAKKVSKAQVVQPEAPVQVAPVTPAPVPVKVKKEPETAESKWARRLSRWAGKAGAAGCDVKALLSAELSA